ncbi:major capsid protein [Microvirus mar25]|uniref:Major capsid protein n=1 Tax=Microvirus mar25 TaxID=2851158 RepID=A0A8F5MKJ9_9VIRU|nr:major capsid protein [Microvirus mar25]
MNRNVESHFSRLPSANVPRSVFDRSFSHKTTFNVGDLVPIYCEEVLPGDTVQIDTSKVVRMQTLLSPVFDNMYLDTYYFFVPNRILWDHWVNFMGQNDSSPWIQDVEYEVPAFFTVGSSGGVGVGTVADYFGLPLGVPFTPTAEEAPGDSTFVSALPFRAYSLIYNEFFRDENLQDPVNIDLSDSFLTYDASDPSKGGIPFKAAKYHDYFTSCLPAPQKGPSVRVPMEGVAPVHAIPGWTPAGNWASHGSDILSVYGDPNSGFYRFAGSGSTVNYGAVTPPYSGNGFSIDNLGAYLGENASAVGIEPPGIDVNALRLASVTQIYYETLARGGSRYEEMISSFFGVQNPDLRLQHPEYLGGNRIQVNVHEIVNTAQAEQDFLGDLGAMSVTADTHSDFTKSFTEYGWLIGLCVCRYDHTYSQGVPRKFTRMDKFDYYNPVFARIGEQPVYDSELYATVDNLRVRSIFGYQEAWASYRYSPNMVSGYLRPSVDNSLAHWTLADNYASQPTLSPGWIVEDKTNVDRALAVTSSVSPQLFGDFYFNARWTRPMPMYSIPGPIGVF